MEKMMVRGDSYFFSYSKVSNLIFSLQKGAFKFFRIFEIHINAFNEYGKEYFYKKIHVLSSCLLGSAEKIYNLFFTKEISHDVDASLELQKTQGIIEEEDSNFNATQQLFEMAKKGKFNKQELIELKNSQADFLQREDDAMHRNIPIFWLVANGHFDHVKTFIEVGGKEQLFVLAGYPIRQSILSFIISKGYENQTYSGRKILTSSYDLVKFILEKLDLLDRKKLLNLKENLDSEFMEELDNLWKDSEYPSFRNNHLSHPNGNYPLHLAYLRHDEKMIKLLIHYGALENVRNDQGKTPMELMDIKYEDVCKILKDRVSCFLLKKESFDFSI